MSITMDSHTRKKLALVKQLYQQAVFQSVARYSVVNRVLSVIGFDLAVESALRIVISTLNPNERTDTDRPFGNLVKKADHEMKNTNCGAIQEEGPIKVLHNIRNDAQHNSRYPSEVEASNCKNIAFSFLNKLFEQIWDESLDTISLVDFVSNPVARGFLKEAEDALAQNDYETAVKYADAGLSWTVDKVRRTLTYHPFRYSSSLIPDIARSSPGIAHSSTLFRGRTSAAVEDDIWEAIVMIEENISRELKKVYEVIKETREELYKDIEVTENTMAYFTLGIDHTNLLRFRRIVGETHFYQDENQVLKFNTYRVKENLERADAEFAVSYSTDTVIWIETQVGDIENPFSN